MQNSPVTAVIVGGGHRAFIYADYSLTHPNELKIVGIADPDKQRCDAAAKKYGFPAENCFNSVEELTSKGKIADVIINGTMDNLHVSTSVPLMKLGYDMLIEKPVAVNERELEVLIDTAEKYGTKVMVCHVLRYSDFYREIKKIISEGKLGEILNIQLCENVSYHHYATSYIRGKWANSDKCGTSMLLAKCCHDMDLMMWLMGGVKPKYVSSMGGRQYFRRENAPKDAGERCLLDCPYIDTCNLSAKRIYLDLPGKWDFYVWPELHDAPYQEKYEYLKNISPYGKCAYKCDNNVVDHQTVTVQFENGATGSHNMTGGCAYSQRIITIIGSLGEIRGVFEDQKFTVSYINPTADGDHTDEITDISDKCSAYVDHGGGDHALVEDFIKYVRGEKTSISCTSLDDSLDAYRVVFAADKSMSKNGFAVVT